MTETMTATLLALMEIIAPILLLAALIYGTVQWSRRRRSRALEQARDAKTRQLYTDKTARTDDVGTVEQELGIVPKDESGLLTEDEMQRRTLGPRGVPGEPDPARMTPQRQKKTPDKVDPGHTS